MVPKRQRPEGGQLYIFAANVSNLNEESLKTSRSRKGPTKIKVNEQSKDGAGQVAWEERKRGECPEEGRKIETTMRDKTKLERRKDVMMIIGGKCCKKNSEN